MNRHAVNFAEKFEAFTEQWAPRVVAEMNDLQFKLVKIEGEFVWHSHTDTDEAFVVLEGQMTIEFRDGSVDLQAGEMFVVPRGVEHKPMAARECRVMVIEPRGVILISNHKRPKRYIAHCSSDSLWQLNHSKQHNL